MFSRKKINYSWIGRSILYKLQGPRDLLDKNGAVLKLDQMNIPIVGK